MKFLFTSQAFRPMRHCRQAQECGVRTCVRTSGTEFCPGRISAPICSSLLIFCLSVCYGLKVCIGILVL